jgi:hypothetical protein
VGPEKGLLHSDKTLAKAGVVQLSNAVTGNAVQTQTALGSSARDLVPQIALAMLEAEQSHGGQRTAGERVVATSEEKDLCSWSDDMGWGRTNAVL